MEQSQQKDKPNIIFIGMSGSGKTTISKYLTKHAGYNLIDTDRLIEDYCHGKHLQKIVDSYKKDYHDFLILERKVAQLHFANKWHSGNAIATGGSFCYSAEVLKSIPGTIYYLHITWDRLQKRILDFGNRGFICFKKNLNAEYHHRIHLYKDIADIIINCNDKSIAEVANEVIAYENDKIRAIKENLKKTRRSHP